MLSSKVYFFPKSLQNFKHGFQTMTGFPSYPKMKNEVDGLL